MGGREDEGKTERKEGMEGVRKGGKERERKEEGEEEGGAEKRKGGRQERSEEDKAIRFSGYTAFTGLTHGFHPA